MCFTIQSSRDICNSKGCAIIVVLEFVEHRSESPVTWIEMEVVALYGGDHDAVVGEVLDL